MPPSNINKVIGNTIRQIGRTRPSLLYSQLTAKRAASTKHPNGFVPPTTEDLAELRERVQEFTSEFQDTWEGNRRMLRQGSGREIPEEVAAKTDRDNEFPVEMWKKLGEAG